MPFSSIRKSKYSWISYIGKLFSNVSIIIGLKKNKIVFNIGTVLFS